MPPLEEIQREFFDALRSPLRGASRRSTGLPPDAGVHSPGFLATAERLMKPAADLSPAERLELYHRQYWFRLLDSVAEDFPVLRRMAGEGKFWELIEAYLLARPSGSFTLRHLGRSMAEFVAGWDGFDEVRRRWFSALATIEYAGMEVFEAPEREPVRPEALAEGTLELQPHLRLMSFPVPADLCFGWESFSPAEETPVHIAVWRGPSGGAMRARLDPVERELLGRLSAGAELGSIFAEPIDPEPSPEAVHAWFATWQSRGWITTRDAHAASTAADGGWEGVDKMGSQARAMDGA